MKIALISYQYHNKLYKSFYRIIPSNINIYNKLDNPAIASWMKLTNEYYQYTGDILTIRINIIVNLFDIIIFLENNNIECRFINNILVNKEVATNIIHRIGGDILNNNNLIIATKRQLNYYAINKVNMKF